MPIFCTAKAWEEYGIDYAVHKSLWRNCVLATLGPQPDKGTVARDLSGRGNSGALTGATHLPIWGNWFHRGQAFRAVTCDGTEDCVTIPDSEGLRFGNGTADVPFTVAGWMRVVSVAANGEVLLSKSGTTSTSCDYNFAWGSDSNFYAVLYDLNGTNHVLRNTTGAPLVLNAWHHIAVTYSGSGGSAGLAIYFNGTQPATGTESVGSYTAMHGAAQSQRIGAFVPSDAAKQFLAGSIASVFAWRRVLSPAEIITLARGPLTPYEVRLPEFFFGASTAVALTVAGSAVSVTSDSPTLTQHQVLTVQSSQLATASQSPVLLQHNAVAVGNAVCSVMAGNVLLTQHHALSVDGSAVATTSEAVSLTQHNALEVGNSSCAVATESLALTQHGSLSVNGSAIGVTAQQVALTQHSALTLGNSICAVTSDNVALTQHGALTVQVAACVVSSENLTLTAHAPAHVSLTVAGSKCSVTSGAVSLTQHNVMAVAASAVVVTASNVTLAYHAAGVGAIVEHQTLLLAI